MDLPWSLDLFEISQNNATFDFISERFNANVNSFQNFINKVQDPTFNLFKITIYS